MTETQPKGPLAGIRVIDLTQFVLGPYATQTLGDLGADIIKIEDPGGDRQRSATGKVAPSADMGPVFIQLNRNKRSVVLDLKTEDGRESLKKLIATADVFIHNMRVESVAKLGFSYAEVAAIKPDIVYVEAMGYGSDGPYAGRQAFDDLIQAASGTMAITSLYDGDPALRPLPSIIADKTCGLFAVIAVQAALLHRAKTGEGQYVEVPMLETFTGFMMTENIYGHTYVPTRGKFGHPTTVTPHRRPVKTKDGAIMVMPANIGHSRKFLELAGAPDVYQSEAYLNETDGKKRVAIYYNAIAAAAAVRTTDEWMQICNDNLIPAMRANTLDEALEDPHLKATVFEERDLPGDLGKYRAMRPGLRFARTPCDITRDPPRLGQDTSDVLAEIADGS